LERTELLDLKERRVHLEQMVTQGLLVRREKLERQDSLDLLEMTVRKVKKEPMGKWERWVYLGQKDWWENLELMALKDLLDQRDYEGTMEP